MGISLFHIMGSEYFYFPIYSGNKVEIIIPLARSTELICPKLVQDIVQSETDLLSSHLTDRC